MLEQETGGKNQGNRHLTVAPSIAIDRTWSNKTGGVASCSRESRTAYDNFFAEKTKMPFSDFGQIFFKNSNQKQHIFQSEICNVLAVEEPTLGGGGYNFKTG